MYRVEKVTAQNFGSFRELSFPVHDQGLVLILGRNKNTGGNNGAGKSMLAESLFYPIFESTIRGIRGTEIVNVSVGKDMLVELDVVVDDKQFRIRNGKKVEGRNKVYEVLKEGSDKSLGLPDEWWIEKIGYGQAVFSGLAVVSGSNPHPLVDGTDKVKKDYLTDLFSLHIYDKCHDIVKNRISELEQTKQDSETLVSNKEWEIKSEQENVLSSEEVQEKTDMLSECRRAIKGLDSELKQALQDLGTVRSKHSQQSKQRKLVESINSIKSELEDLEEELGNRVYKLEAGEKKIEEVSELLNKDFAEQRLVTNQISEIKKLGDSCPTCLQPITPQKKEELLTTLKMGRDKLKERCEKNENLLARGKELVKKVRRYSSQKELLENLEEQLVDKDLGKSLDTQVEDLQKTIDSLDEELKETRQEMEELTVTLTKTTEAKNRIAEGKELIDGWNKQVEKVEEDIKYWEFLLRAFGQYGIKSVKLDSILDTLNYCVQEYMSVLTSSQISAVYKPVEKKATDKFELFVIDSAGERSFKSWSGGEKKRVLIAVLLGIWQTAHELCSTPPNFVFLDDCFGDLDEIGQERVSELMRSIALEGRSVFVTSPVERSDVRFDQVWYVEKDGEFSELRIGG